MKYKKNINTQRMKILNKKISIESEVFKIKAFVSKINLEVFENFISKSGRGQHVIPVWIPVSVWIFAYSKGEQRYRQVSELCKKHDDYYWLSNGFEPSPAYFEQWKLRILPYMEKLRQLYLNYLRDNELIHNEILGVDGVKTEVWASKEQSKTEKQIEKEIEKLARSISEGELTHKQKLSNEKRKNKLTERKTELIHRKESSKTKTESEKDKMRINITTPETVILHRRDGEFIQGVNIQGVANQDQIINVLSTEFCSNDIGLLKLMYDRVCTFLNVALLKIFFLADSGYWSLNDIKELDPEKGYKIIIASISQTAKERKRKCGNKGKGGLTIDDGFKYDETKDLFVCPAGCNLTFNGRTTSQGKYTRRVYRASIKDCKHCSIHKQCLGDVKDKTKHVRIPDEPPEIKRMKDYYNIPEHRELYKKRKVINEPVHGQMISNLSITKLHCISAECIKGEVALIGLIHTLKKVEKMYGSYFPVGFNGKYYFFVFIFY